MPNLITSCDDHGETSYHTFSMSTYENNAAPEMVRTEPDPLFRKALQFPDPSPSGQSDFTVAGHRCDGESMYSIRNEIPGNFTQARKSVTFNTSLNQIYELPPEDRKSPWMQLVADRIRFRRRIRQLEALLVFKK